MTIHGNTTKTLLSHFICTVRETYSHKQTDTYRTAHVGQGFFSTLYSATLCTDGECSRHMTAELHSNTTALKYKHIYFRAQTNHIKTHNQQREIIFITTTKLPKQAVKIAFFKNLGIINFQAIFEKAAITTSTEPAHLCNKSCLKIADLRVICQMESVLNTMHLSTDWKPGNSLLAHPRITLSTLHYEK